MCSSEDELRKLANWQGKGVGSRQKLMEKLQGNVYLYKHFNDFNQI